VDSVASRVEAIAGPEIGDPSILVAYKYLNFISHSCLPNCRIVDLGRGETPRWELRSVVPIPPRTELTIDYDETSSGPDQETEDEGVVARLLSSVNDRRKFQLRTYGYRCQCDACANLDDTDEIRALLTEQYDEILKPGLEKLDTDYVETNIDEFVFHLRKQHLFNLARIAHERAAASFKSASQDPDLETRDDLTVEEVKSIFEDKAKEHILSSIEMRRLLYGPKDKKIGDLMKEWLPSPPSSGRRTKDDDGKKGKTDKKEKIHKAKFRQYVR